MPTYSYACIECDNRFDAVQAFSDDALTECPECSGPLRKLFGKIGVVFKGSGFYRTDSRAGANGSSKSSSTGEKKVSAESSNSSSDSSSGDSSSKSTSEAKSTPAPAAAAS